MNVIKTVSPAHPNRETAEDVQAGLLTLPGVRLSYIDQDNRVITFATDFHPDSTLMPGQERITLTFPAADVRATERTEKEQEFFQNVGDALMGRGPYARPTR